MTRFLRVRLYAELVAMAALPLAFALIPPAALESWPRLCVWRALFDAECPACGIVRALSLALHGDFAAAYAKNPLVVVVAPLLLALLAHRLVVIFKRLYPKE